MQQQLLMSFPMTQLMADALFKKQQLIAFNNLFDCYSYVVP